ncbi:hypothetical protein NQZ68_041829 [Dissostichus eleginoides]|nr:hypothetical protein NQZ68_041829 [Dissostichus eleginoides]
MESVQLLVLVLMWNRSSGSLFQNQTKTRFSPFLPPTLTRFSHPVLPVLLHVSSVFRRVERRFLSVTIDSSLASEEKFMSLLGSPKVRTLAKALSPAFLRFGGTRQDFMEFSPIRRGSSSSAEKSSSARLLPSWLEQRLKKEWSRQQILLKKEDLHRKYKRVKFTEYTVDLLHSFSNCSGLDLIFGLNALLRTSENIWNGSNARSLLQYCESRGYQMDWELGNVVSRGYQMDWELGNGTLTFICRLGGSPELKLRLPSISVSIVTGTQGSRLMAPVGTVENQFLSQ